MRYDIAFLLCTKVCVSDLSCWDNDHLVLPDCRVLCRTVGLYKLPHRHALPCSLNQGIFTREMSFRFECVTTYFYRQARLWFFEYTNYSDHSSYLERWLEQPPSRNDIGEKQFPKKATFLPARLSKTPIFFSVSYAMSLSKIPWSHFGPHHPFPDKQRFPNTYYRDAPSFLPLGFSISAALNHQIPANMSNSTNMNALSQAEMERFQKLSNEFEPDVQVWFVGAWGTERDT